MKKKRIVLHIVTLALALAGMVCVALGTLKWISFNSSWTKEEQEEAYGDYYIQCVEETLGNVYEQLNNRKKPIENFGLPKFEFYVTIAKEGSNKKIFTNYRGKDSERSNICTFNKNGMHIDTKQKYRDDFVTDRLYNMLNEKSFYNEELGREISFKKLQKLCEKKKFYIEMYTLRQEGFKTYIDDWDDEFKLEVSRQQQESWKREAVAYYIIAGVFALLVLFPYIWLLVIAGHKEKKDKPKLQKIDKLWMDVEIIVAVSIYAMAMLLTGDEFYDGLNVSDSIVFGVWIFISMLAVEAILQISESIARRLKTKSFIRTTMIGVICIYLKKAICQIFHNLKLTGKVIFMCVVLDIVLFFDYSFAEMSAGLFGALFLISIPVAVIGVVVWNYYKEKELIIEETEKLAGGEADNKINDEMMRFPSNKKLAESVNGIGEGLSRAVSSALKNERMKTELITNVSHDLKTPLTSIINYVDLLKTDGLDSEKAPEYLDVLDKKSQRLKTLTEDLVEASKLNSGVVELNVENIDIVQLVNQSLAEYSERFEKSGLHIIKNITKDTIIVCADGRKTWRVLDNLYSNVCKYAMPGTRVYIDVIDEENNSVISIKNISASALNFSADELMERFVRGDLSRTTEGSGLGLSIARSIMEKQDGELKITLDGDLFKAELKLSKRG